MRLRMVLTTVLTFVAALGLVSPATAYTGNNYTGFFEINQSNELVHWDKSSGSYQSQLIGPEWQDTKLIAALSTDQVVQVRNDNTLWDWKVDHTDNDRWKGYFVGGGWSDVRAITGLGSNNFLALTTDGVLKEYFSALGNHVYTQPRTASGFAGLDKIAGRGSGAFIGIDFSGNAASYGWGSGTWSATAGLGPNWGNVRLVAGISDFRFAVVRTDGVFVEWNQASVLGPWIGTPIGGGWANTRLLG